MTGFPDTVALQRASRYPDTRYMGSKQSLVPFIAEVLAALEFDTVLDAMSGSGVVAYLLKAMGKAVVANDYLEFCWRFAQAGVENPTARLDTDEVEALCRHDRHADDFIQRTFAGLYFKPEDSAFLDSLAANVEHLDCPHKRALALAAAARACLKSRPRGVFTYTGLRYDDGRRDLRISLEQQFREAVEAWNGAVFDNGRGNLAVCGDVFELNRRDFDLVYVDPPYVSPHSDNWYTRRYHFVEGLMSYWRRVEIQHGTKTKKIPNRPTPFSSRRTIHQGLDDLFGKFPCSTLVVSYSSSGIPSRGEMLDILRAHRRHVEVHAQNHSYTFGTHGHKVGNTNNRVQEYLFVAQD